jgi:hypothetical protein
MFDWNTCSEGHKWKASEITYLECISAETLEKDE